MPHPERAFLPWQLHYLPQSMKGIQASPWLKMFQNAYAWCMGE
jgi:phosphoribosylformylglycinamidine synthase